MRCFRKALASTELLDFALPFPFPGSPVSLQRGRMASRQVLSRPSGGFSHLSDKQSFRKHSSSFENEHLSWPSISFMTEGLMSLTLRVRNNGKLVLGSLRHHGPDPQNTV